MNREKTVKVLEEYFKSKKDYQVKLEQNIETKDIKDNVSVKELNELKQLFLSKIDEMKNEIINYQKNIGYQMLNDIINIEDQDLEFNLPLKKRNCFHVKDVEKARDLGGIPTLKDLERVIDNDEYQDIIEVKNTLICLESVIEERKNDKLKLVELDQEIHVKQDFSQWKSKYHSLLGQLIFDIIESDQFKVFEIIQRIKNDFNQMKKKGKLIDRKG